jgi:surfeit locus 1 family protein
MSPRARIVFFVLTLLVAAVCVRLGLWQRSRLQERRAHNAEVAARRGLPVEDVLAAGGTRAERRVRATGTYDAAHEMLLRNQVVREVPGVLVVTPLRLAASDSAVLVIRGFVGAPDGLNAPGLDSLAEAGAKDVEGVALPLEARADSGRPLLRDGRTSWQRLDLAALRERLPYPVLDVAILQAPAPGLPRTPRRQEPRALDEGAHQSYMLQWFAFATIALVTGTIVLRGRRAARWSEPTAPEPSAGARPPAPPA